MTNTIINNYEESEYISYDKHSSSSNNNKCLLNKIRNPATNRCINLKTAEKKNLIKTKKPTTQLLQVPKLNTVSKPIKTCPEGKILNPKTNRCNKIKQIKPTNKTNKL